MLLRNASALEWGMPPAPELVDVRLTGGTIAEIGHRLERRAAEAVFDLEGARLVPGLHDHHLHLRALAAVESSVIVGPPEIQNAHELSERLRTAGAHLMEGQWLRGVAYHQSVAGDLDRWRLDALVPDRPVRIQHASGVLWILNSAGIAALDIRGDAPAGAERDDTGVLTGRFWREDEWLGSRLPRTSHDFSGLSQLAASRGVTGFTDATPGAHEVDLAGYLEAVENKTLVQRLCLMAEPGVAEPESELVTLGPTKVLLDDMTLPTFDELAAQIRHAHDADRPVAVHCVTRTQSILTLAVLEQVGVHEGDRIEHGSILGVDAIATIARLGICVVTQPGFIVTRGDRFLRDVPAPSRPDLYRLGSLLAAGVVVAGSTDAPFGDPDPWVGLQAAALRRTLGGQVLGPEEGVDGPTALALFTGDAAAPARQRTVAVGQPADLCVVEPGTAGYAAGPGPEIRATFVAGRLIYTAP